MQKYKYLYVTGNNRNIYIKIVSKLFDVDFVDFLHDNGFKILESNEDIYKDKLYHGFNVEVLNINLYNDINVFKNVLNYSIT